MTSAVRIPVQDGDRLGFDLREVMDAVGPHPELDWYLYDAYLMKDVTAIWPEGIEIEERTNQFPGLQLTWAEMKQMAGGSGQVVDGYFRGYDGSGQPQLELAAVDSTYWSVWARDQSILENVRASFRNAQDHVGLEPQRLS